MTNDELKLLEEVILFASGKTHTYYMQMKVNQAKTLVQRDLKMKQLEKDIPFLNKDSE